MVSSSLAVFRYELKKSFGIGTTIFWLFVILFPTILQLLIDKYFVTTLDLSATILAAMIPGAVCLITILVAMTPYLSTELEGNLWPYVATRPYGRTAIMFGKYLVAVTRSLIAGLLAIAIIFPSTSLNQLNIDVPQPFQTSGTLGSSVTQANPKESITENTELSLNAKTKELNPSQGYPLWLALVCLVILSSICYSALFCLLGTIMYKRPMIIAIIYTLIVEVIISFLPVVANGLTLNFYLRSIYVRSLELELEQPVLKALFENPNFLSQSSTSWDLIFVGLLAFSFLFAANTLLRNREYHVGETL
ncbi:MAG: hypothetical protein VX876_00145 [Planctomycetota bacterium]|nr:hypothetical protein [Planctomycetota bacterium]